MTTSIGSKTLKKQKAKEGKIIQKNGQIELLSRCLFKKSRNLINHVFNIFTFLPFEAELDLYLNYSLRKSRFP